MVGRVRWTRRALATLSHIDRTIRKERPAAAVAVVSRVKQSVENLASHPLLGRPGRVLGTREFVVLPYPYILAYRQVEQGIEVLAVLHAAREWPERLD